MRTTVMALGLAMTFVGCGGAKMFTADEVGGILLQPQEAPAGTIFRTDMSHRATLDQFAQGFDELRAKWAGLGFQDGEVHIFMSSTAPGDPNGLTIGNGAMVFDTEDHASQALRIFHTLGIPHLTTQAVDVPTADLGDESFAVRFDKGPEGMPGAICVVRVTNVLFQVPASGRSITADDVIAIARTIATRAQRLHG
jgi:hypothetical protein